MILALNEFQRIPCACHMLTTVLSHTLQLKSLSKNYCPINENDPSLSIVEDIKSTVAAVKSITTYFKQTGLNKKLKTSLKQSNDTRWNTTLYMLLSYNECKDEIEAILPSHGKRSYLHFFQNSFFFIFCIVFTFFNMSEKISLLGSVVSEIEMSYLHFK